MHKPASLVTTAEVAAALGVHVRTVHRMVARGELTPAFKAPGLRGPLLFDKEAVDALSREDAA
jgi:excisionase family DNA binding protein